MRDPTESFYSNHRILINISIFFFTVTLKQRQNVILWTGFVTNIHARVFCWVFFGQNGISPGHLSHCVMGLLQHKNKKGSYKSLQVDRSSVNFGSRQENVAARRKIGEAEEFWQPGKKKMKQRHRAALKTLRGGGWRKAQLQVVGGTQSEVKRQNMVKILPQEGRKYPFPLPKNGLSEGSQRNQLCPLHWHRGRTRRFEIFPGWDELKSRSGDVPLPEHNSSGGKEHQPHQFQKLNARRNLQQKNFSLRMHLNKSSMISTQ